MEATSVYLYYDVRKVLLYVGITKQGPLRQIAHAHWAEWWPFVASQEVEHFDTRADAMRREELLIKSRGPVFNVVHNTGYNDRRRAYFTLFATERLPGLRARCGHCPSCTRWDGEEGRHECDTWEPEGDEEQCEHCGVPGCVFERGIAEGELRSEMRQYDDLRAIRRALEDASGRDSAVGHLAKQIVDAGTLLLTNPGSGVNRYPFRVLFGTDRYDPADAAIWDASEVST